MDESGTEYRDADFSRKEERCRCYYVPGHNRSLQLDCASVLHDELIVPVFMYSSETRIRKEKRRPQELAEY